MGDLVPKGAGEGLTPRQVDERHRVSLSPEVLDALDVGPGDFIHLHVKGRFAKLVVSDEDDMEARMVDSRKRILLPRSVSKALRLGHGDYAAFIIKDHEARLYKLSFRIED